MKKYRTLFILSVFTFLFFNSPGQSDLLTLLDHAGSNYPGIAARMAKADALKEQVSLGQNTILPSLDVAWQVNYATYNNITGMSYPGMIMPISGPPVSENQYDAVPGSAAALVLKWSPLTFGQRAAMIDHSRHLYEKQLSEVDIEILRVKYLVASLFLDISAFEELTEVYRKNISRTEFSLKQITMLVQSGIRPAVDSLQLKGELARARSDLYLVENQLSRLKLELQELLAGVIPVEEYGSIFFYTHLPALPFGEVMTGQNENPVLLTARQELESQKSLLRQVALSWTPRIDFWGTTNARGSGVGVDGSIDKSSGWSFSRYNYGVGVQVAFPVFELANHRMKTRYQESLVRSSESQLEQTVLSLDRQENMALGELSTALRVAGEVPVEYEYNEMAYQAIQQRYSSGLTDYSVFIKAQYDLLHSETKLRIAYIDTWKALLRLAFVKGNMDIFLNQIRN